MKERNLFDDHSDPSNTIKTGSPRQFDIFNEDCSGFESPLAHHNYER